MIRPKYLIVYDITKNKLRRKVQKELEKYGFRWQYSTYYCEIPKKQLNFVKEKLDGYMDKSDSIIWIPLTDKLIHDIDFMGNFKFKIKKGEINIF